MKPSVRQLEAHIRTLLKQYNLSVRWDDISPRYVAEEKRVYLPLVKSLVSYVVCLHEIGHSQDLKHQKDFSASLRLLNELQRMKATRPPAPDASGDPDAYIAALNEYTENLRKINVKCMRFVKRAGGPKPIWQREAFAWKWARTHALDWNKACDGEMMRCMLSYWHAHAKNPIQGFYEWFDRYMGPLAKIGA